MLPGAKALEYLGDALEEDMDIKLCFSLSSTSAGVVTASDDKQVH